VLAAHRHERHRAHAEAGEVAVHRRVDDPLELAGPDPVDDHRLAADERAAGERPGGALALGTFDGLPHHRRHLLAAGLDGERAERAPVLGRQGDHAQVADELADQLRRLAGARTGCGFRPQGHSARNIVRA
jgi:hypothetical protein